MQLIYLGSSVISDKYTIKEGVVSEILSFLTGLVEGLSLKRRFPQNTSYRRGTTSVNL